MIKPIQQTLILALGMSSPLIASGAILNVEEAKNVAAEFFQSGEVHRLASKDAFDLAHVATDGSFNPVCYIFNAKDGKGFVIVSADDTSLPVVGYSVSSTWNGEQMPDAAGTVLSRPVANLYGGYATRSAGVESRLLQTPTWSQEAPFNNNIPNRRLTGCVGIALAEILKYHSFPATRPASLVKEGESTTYGWDNMRSDNYRNGYSQTEADVVATLVADAAIAIGTDFGMSSSSAFEVKVPYALTSMFGYDSGVSYKKRSEMDKESWDALIVNEIEEGRPVLYSGQDVSAGHAFVCDGYEIRGGYSYFHINWGWGGAADGYYASDALNPVVSSSHSFNDLTTIVYNIKPAANSIEWSPIHITSDERQVGLTLDVADVEPGGTFTARAGSLKNISDVGYSGSLSIALYDGTGKMKCLLNDGRGFSLGSLQMVKYVDFNCKVPSDVSVEDGDVVRLVTKANGESGWLPVAGDLLAGGDVRARGGVIPYFSVAIPASVEGVEITSSDSRVIKGRDYSFTVVPTSVDKVVTVKANGFILTADASNVYKLSNVVEDQKIDIIVQDASEVLSKSTLWVEAGSLQQLIGEKESATIVDLTLFGTMNVNDFTFIRDRMKLKRLDISQVSIQASGSNPANAIPANALSGCESLESIVLPSNVNTFKSGCFSYSGLRSIEIPASVATYEYNIFLGCYSLREVTVRRSTPAWVNWCVFQGTPKARLVVPTGATAAYQAKEYWQDFKEIAEEDAVAPSVCKVMVQESKGLNITTLTEGTEVAPGTEFRFMVESDDSFGDATMEVYANSTRLYPDSDGVYKATVNKNTLFHVDFRYPQATYEDTGWKITGDAGGIGLVTDVINVTPGKAFTVRANAIKVPSGDEAVKFFSVVLTDKDGGIKEFISPVMSNTLSGTGNLSYNFTCQVKDATVREGNYVRIATSYNKKNWYLVNAESDTIVDRISAIGNRVVYHSVHMPESVNGAVIQGGATQVVRGMPFNLKVIPVSTADRITLSVNGINKAVKAAIANLSIPSVTEDLEIAIQVNAADADDYVVVNVREGELASKIAACPSRLKVIGTILSTEFDAFRNNSGTIVDLDLSDVTIKGAVGARNAIPSNAFVPSNSLSASALKTVILPSNLESIEESAFYRCTNLQEITLPSTVTYVGSGAFSTCVGLQKIMVLGSVPPATGNMSPFPANTSGITLEVPKGSESAYGAASYWNTLGQSTAATYYNIQIDPTRSFGYNQYYNDLTKILYEGKALSITVGLPNCTLSRNSIRRPGEAFKLYDNGEDVTGKSYFKYGQYSVTFDEWYQPDNIKHPQDHVIDVEFYYGITFQLPEGVSAEIVNLEEGDRWDEVDMSMFDANSTATKTLYREGKDYKFRLDTSSPNVKLDVRVENKIITKLGAEPEYEWPIQTVLPDENGYYTVSSLPGNSWVKVAASLVPVEGEPIPSGDLAVVNKEDVASFSELAVTGDMDANALKSLREKFESVETLDLTGIDNTSIPADAFTGMTSLKNVVMSDNVSEIGASSFKGCENLESVTFPGVNTIGEGAFEGCVNLTSIIIPASTASTRAAAGINAASFKGVNPNCLIYLSEGNIADADSLNVILNEKGARKAASDISLDGAYAFSAPASFSLGEHRISFTVDLPASKGSDVDAGWKGLMLPFAPTGMEYGEEFAEREGSGLKLVSFDGEDSETLTSQASLLPNRPYLASMSAPFEKVAVTFYAEGQSVADSIVYDIPYTPTPEMLVASGKDYSLYGSFNGETRNGSYYGLNERGDSFVKVEGDGSALSPFSAYLCANGAVAAEDFKIGNHPFWVFEPASSKNDGSKLYRSSKIELSSETEGAVIYYTLDGSDPASADSDRKVYDSPLDMVGEEMTVKAVAEYKGNVSENMTFGYELKRTDMNYTLAENWNWISHNMENAVAVSEFAGEGIVRILSQTEEVVRDPKYGLVGKLLELNPAEAYKVCVSDASWTGRIAGVSFDPSAPVRLNKGWNWIGCPVDDASLLITDLLANAEAEEGDMLVGLDGFDQVDADGVWKGTLSSLTPGHGYMYFSNSDKEFVYNMVPATEASLPTRSESVSVWVADNHRYPSVMPVTAMLTGCESGDASDFEVGAFCGDECRGTGVYVDGVVMINVHGNAGDEITFRILSPNHGERVSVSSVRFDEMPLGSFGVPYEINLSESVSVDDVFEDGCEIVTDNGEIRVKGDVSGLESVEVYDLSGTRLALSTEVADGGISLSGLAPGVRIVVVRIDGRAIYRKIMVK
ncbi:MAG: C10 family peptidase [Muribaculaceae bacterium]|nr:C10 family peptidase [Muribaculaceae bacterium]